jgi:hypothetical protein
LHCGPKHLSPRHVEEEELDVCLFVFLDDLRRYVCHQRDHVVLADLLAVRAVGLHQRALPDARLPHNHYLPLDLVHPLLPSG